MSQNRTTSLSVVPSPPQVEFNKYKMCFEEMRSKARPKLQKLMKGAANGSKKMKDFDKNVRNAHDKSFKSIYCKEFKTRVKRVQRKSLKQVSYIYLYYSLHTSCIILFMLDRIVSCITLFILVAFVSLC